MSSSKVSLNSSPSKLRPNDGSTDSSPKRDRGGALRRSSTVLYPSSAGTRNISAAVPRAGSPQNLHENPLEKIKKNSKGGVLVTPEEIATAFAMLDENKTGTLTLNSLKKRLGCLFPEMSAKEYRFLMNNKKELTVEDLKELLIDNDLTNFDPIYDAFRVFDTENKGVMNDDKLRRAFMMFGFGELSDEELDILRRTADLDGDGQVTLEDFRGMIDNQPHQKKPVK